MRAQDPPSSLQRQLDELRRAHPWRQVDDRGTQLRYRALGARSAIGVLLLPGAVGSGEVFLRLAAELADRFRLVMVAYPRVVGLEELLGGLRAALDAEGIERAHLVGGSFGGTVAQAFRRRFPERSGGAVLSATAPPDPERAPRNERWLRRLRWLPMPLLRGLLRLVVRRLMTRVEVEPQFWLRYYLGAIGELTRADLESRYRVSIDFDRLPPAAADPESGVDQGVLVLAGAEDRMADRAQLEALRAAYPGAEVRTFSGAGHGLSLERPEEWAAAVAGFLRADR